MGFERSHTLILSAEVCGRQFKKSVSVGWVRCNNSETLAGYHSRERGGRGEFGWKMD